MAESLRFGNFSEREGTDAAPSIKSPFPRTRQRPSSLPNFPNATRLFCPNPRSPQPYRLPLKINFPVGPLFDRSLERVDQRDDWLGRE
jgi:hypothetical protein